MNSGPGKSLGRLIADRNGDPVYVAWCQMPGGEQAAQMVRAGFAGVVADMQHGSIDHGSMCAMVQAVARAGGIAMMRPPLDDVSTAARALDAGAATIIAPMINTAEDARGLAEATRYPPVGSRSFGPAPALELWDMDAQAYLKHANSMTTVLAMIETAEALANVESIVAVDGIDGVFVGPYDLSISLSGGEVGGAADPLVQTALPQVVNAARGAGGIAGVYASGSEQARGFVEVGFNLVSVASDTALVHAGANKMLDALP